MTPRRWALPLPITAGFVLAFGLFAVAGLSALYDQTHVVPFDVVRSALPEPERLILDQLLADRAQRRERSIARNLVVTFLGTMMAALTLIVLNRQTRAQKASEEERERLLRAEVAQAEEARTLEERARTNEALRLSWEELLRTSERARVQAERARTLVDSNIIGVFVARGESVTEANDAYLDLLGYTREELFAGKVLWGPAVSDPAPGEPRGPMQRELLGKDGRRIQVLLGVAELPGAPGERVCFVVDQTERERTLAALRAAQAQAEAVNQAKDQFLAVLSHELRSPLHAMLGWLSILKKGVAAGRNVDRAMEVLERNVLLQARLVDDLLDVSRIVSNKLVIEEEPVDLAMVVQATVESARPGAEAKGVDLACEVAPLSQGLVGDEKRLRQMVGNLVANAIKFTPAGGTVTVTLSAQGDREATVEVRDDGMGIPPEFLPHAFERFRLADASNTRSYGGLGLGLAIVKTLTELHGGRVEASSRGMGKGATFLLHLPLRPAPGEAARASSEIALAARDLAGLVVLLVEDDPDGREALRLSLEHAGARVLEGSSAEEARRAMKDAAPDVIISDVGMPGENGYAFLRGLRARGKDRIPAIAISGFASKQDREEALAAGFDDHVAKPVDADVLVVKLLDLLRRSSPPWGQAAARPARGA